MAPLKFLSKLHIAGLAFISLVSVIIIFIEHEYMKIFAYVGIFLIIILFLFLYRKNHKKILSWIHFGFAILITISQDSSSFSGIGFMFFSYRLDCSRNKNIVKFFLLISSIAMRPVFMDITPSQMIDLIFIHSFLLILYYFIFYEKKEKLNFELDDQTEQIIFYLVNGYEIKEIAEKVYMTPAAINKRIQRLKKECMCKTVYQLIYLLSEKGQKDNKWTKNRKS